MGLGERVLFTTATFIYFFLPCIFILCLISPRKFNNVLLAAGSLFFYFWGEVHYAWVFLFSAGLNYVAGRLIGNLAHGSQKKIALCVAVVINLALLLCFKYANFLVDNINVLLAYAGISPFVLAPIPLPVGISFITFHALSYVIDVYRGKSAAQKNPMDVLLYLSLFPQLIAGPIIRYSQIAEQIKNRRMSVDLFYEGLKRFIFGLGKKVLIANQIGIVADSIFAMPSENLTAPLAWLGISAYTLQLYFDFSGYSCMAIGLAMLFGFRFPENFNYPYIAKSVQDFWRRWHISLSSWFRDYLYIPLGGNRVGRVRACINLLVVFFLCGLWHGASWNFIVWGLFHGAFLVLERGRLGTLLQQLPPLFGHAYTLLVITVAWVFFRASDLPQSFAFISAMFGGGSADFIGDNALFYLTPDITAVYAMGLLLSAPVWPCIELAMHKLCGRHAVVAACVRITEVLLLGCIFFACLLFINGSSYNPFIYFRF
jgi:alginate O-acetyltransferase complex protein AlgI